MQLLFSYTSFPGYVDRMDDGASLISDTGPSASNWLVEVLSLSRIDLFNIILLRISYD